MYHRLLVFNIFLVGTLAAVLPVAPIIPTSNLYHSQDDLGQYSYGYSEPLSAKSETRSLDGVTRGGYSYYDADGKLQTVQYVADAVNGFQVVASNLPEAPKVPELPKQLEMTPELPKPVEDTPEVSEAKSKHLALVEEAKAKLALAGGDSNDSSNGGAEEQQSHPVQTAVLRGAPVAYAAVPGHPASYSYSYSTYHYPNLAVVGQVAPFAYAAPVFRT